MACFQDGENEWLTLLTLAATFYSHFQLEYRHSQSRKRGIYVINTQARPRQLGTRPLWWRVDEVEDMNATRIAQQRAAAALQAAPLENKWKS